MGHTGPVTGSLYLYLLVLNCVASEISAVCLNYESTVLGTASVTGRREPCATNSSSFSSSSFSSSSSSSSYSTSSSSSSSSYYSYSSYSYYYYYYYYSTSSIKKMTIYSTSPITLGRCKLRCLLSWGAQVFEKSVSPLKTSIPSRTSSLHAPNFRSILCARKSPRGICYAKMRAVQTLLPRNSFTAMSVIQFRRQKRQGREGIMHDERGTGATFHANEAALL